MNHRIALIWGNHYDDKFAHTHHTFWERTLKDLKIEFARFSWTDWQIHMKPEYDLYFFIDFNPNLFQLHRYPQFHPKAFFWWDSFHFPLSYVAQITEMFDKSYFAERLTALQLIALNYKVEWLPPAFYPGCYRPSLYKKIYDFSFVGQPDNTVIRKGHTRKEFFEALFNKYPNSRIEQGVYGEEVNKIYNESKILIDKTIWCNVGTRVFETIGSGGFTLVNTNKHNGLNDLAIEGAHFVSYDDSLEDCISKIDYYLKHEDERHKIATAGHEHFLTNHTYEHRLRHIFNNFGLYL